MDSSKIIKSISIDSPSAESVDIWKPLDDEITTMSIEVKENNRLHHAIINNNVELALTIIAADAIGKKYGERSHINDISGGNSPLLLAFKTGNMKIVNALLDHPCIIDSMHMPDDHGLMPLHWACMLRQNEIIKKLAAILKKDDPVFDLTTPTVQSWGEKNPKELKEITPYFLYINSTPSYLITRSFVDSPALKLITANNKHNEIAAAYTDIIFHMSSLCNNLGWADDIKFKVMGIDAHQSSVIFEKNFKLGIDSFTKHHNSIPIDMEIAERLARTADEKRSLAQLKEKLALASNSAIIPPKAPTL